MCAHITAPLTSSSNSNVVLIKIKSQRQSSPCNNKNRQKEREKSCALSLWAAGPAEPPASCQSEARETPPRNKSQEDGSEAQEEEKRSPVTEEDGEQLQAFRVYVHAGLFWSMALLSFAAAYSLVVVRRLVDSLACLF